MASRFRNTCSLIPYKETQILSLQEAKQKSGWNITCFNLPQAWEITQGENVIIASLDTGVQLNHPDLRHNLLHGKNFVNPKQKPIDINGHGSHCAGIICAENNEIGVVGVAPRSKVMPIKVLDDEGNGNTKSIAQAIYYVADCGVDLISLSLGSPRPTPDIRSAIIYAAKKGIVTFCAAGNAGPSPDVFYPAAYPETIAIGAIDQNFRRAGFTNTGKNLDFMCPGVNILSTVPTNWYSVMSGTSMAQPFACAVAALMLSYAKSRGLQKHLSTRKQYVDLFKKHTVEIKNGKASKSLQGFGIIDPSSFIQYVKSHS